MTQSITDSIPLLHVGTRTNDLKIIPYQMCLKIFPSLTFWHCGYMKGLNPLERLLVNAVHGIRGKLSKRNDDWATEQVMFEVK
ncbi:hypothetical protein BGP_5120 [Beggiatoa sp. PS]|nr:hypothetical protein BGP_5120 [Beggiatoa sp. PS]